MSRNSRQRWAVQVARLFVVFTICWITSVSNAATITLSAVADTCIRANSTGNGWGAYTDIWVGAAGKASNFQRRGLFKFDLSSIPAGSVITAGTLQLTVIDSHDQSVNYNIFRSLKDWTEGTGSSKSGSSTTTGATWADAKKGTLAWATAGGGSGTDYNAAASATTAISTVGTYSWTGTNLVNDLTTWYNNPTQNYGWFLISGSETANAGNTKHFASRNNATAADQPKLVVTYTVASINGTWTSTGGSGNNWGTTGNWSGGVPSAQGDSATFSTGTNPTVDFAGTGVTVSALTFNNASVNYTLQNTGAAANLTLFGAGTSAATIAVTAGSDTIAATVPIVLSSDVTISEVAGQKLTINGNMSGAKAVTQSGPGNLILAGTNSYTGITTISGGTLQFGKQVSLYNNATASWTVTNLVVNSGATLALNVGGTGEFTSANIDTLKALGSASGGFKTGAILGLDTTNATGGTFTYASSIANPNAGANVLGLTKLGTGTLVLSGTNTNTGVTTVSGGTLQLAKQVSLYNNTTASWTATNLVVNSGATLALNVGGTGEFTSANIDTLKALGSASGGFKTGAILGLDTTNATGGTFTYASSITNPNAGANVLGLTKLGTGTLVLSGTNTNTGVTKLAGGTLNLGSSGALSGGGNVAFTGGTLQFSASNTADYGARIKNSTAAIALDTNGQAVAFAGAIDSTNTAGLTKSGTGSLTLSGINTYTGVTTVNAGTVLFQKKASLYNGTTASWTATNLVVNSGATLAFGMGTSEFAATDIDTLKSLGTAAGGFKTGSTLGIDTTNASGTVTYASAIGNTNSGANVIGFNKLGTGTLFLSGTNTYTGNTTVTGGTLQTLALTNNAATTVAAGAQLTTGNAAAGAIAQTNLTVNGNARTDGNLTFSAVFTPATAGAVTLADSTAAALSVGALGEAKLGNVSLTSATGGATIADGGKLTAGNFDNTLGGSFTVGKNSTATVNRVQIAGTLTLQGASGQTGGVTTIAASTPTAPTPSGSNAQVSRVSSLAINNDGVALGTRGYFASLDLKNNDLVINSGGTSLADVTDMIRAGIGTTPNAPTWNGTGLKTSAAITGTCLGAISNYVNPVNSSGGALYTSFDGLTTTTGGETLVKYTWYGDLNLDGAVTAVDAALMDAGYAGTNQANGQEGWYFGDLNYDGSVNASDVTLWQTGRNAYVASGTSLPEPGTLTLFALGLLGTGIWTLGRRRSAIS